VTIVKVVIVSEVQRSGPLSLVRLVERLHVIGTRKFMRATKRGGSERMKRHWRSKLSAVAGARKKGSHTLYSFMRGLKSGVLTRCIKLL
jgi:hypothetical protein